MEREKQSSLSPTLFPKTIYPRSFNKLTVWDYSVVGALLVVSAFLGIYYGVIKGTQNQSQAAYFLGERQLGIAPVAVSLMATFFSALTLVCTLLGV